MESIWNASSSGLKNITLGGYELGRSCDAPMDTAIFLSPFFLAVNFIALVIRLTSTTFALVFVGTVVCWTRTLFHPVKISDNMLDIVVVERHIHGVVKIDVLGLELRLEDSESL